MRLLFLMAGIAPYRAEFFEEIAVRRGISVHFLPWVAEMNQRWEGSITWNSCRKVRLPLGLYYIQEAAHEISERKVDCVIAEFAPKNLTVWSSLLLRRLRLVGGTKIILYGIGPRKGYLKTFILRIMALLADNVLVYETSARQRLQSGWSGCVRCDVLHNTQYVKKLPCRGDEVSKSQKIIYVGALSERKRLDMLVAAASRLAKLGLKFTVEIYGEGPAKHSLMEQVEATGVGSVVSFKDSVFDRDELASVFCSARFACSPGQAGLFVLQSFGYGVPFLTCEHAVSGGEIENIEDAENGIFFDGSNEDLVRKMRLLLEDDVFVAKLSRAAYRKYWAERTVQHMAERFLQGVSRAREP